MLHELSHLIQSRKTNLPEGSYTTSLFASGEDRIIQKVGEEAVEVIIAAKGQDKQRLIEETADLFYHTLVMLTEKGVTLEEVEEELRRRHQK
ncbi:MAG: phosphoribosyl-ATP diphosphatase [Anaerolineales bacterium]|nr:phosphoribosyl-ATP diphosphatase [Anaerolineales bacterium]